MQTRKWIAPIAAFFSVSLGLPLALRLAAARMDAPTAARAAAQQTVVLYDQAAALLEAGRDAEAVVLLQKASSQPLEMPDSADRESVSRDVSSPARMIVLGRMMCGRALREAQTGNLQEAGEWVMQVRRLAVQALATPSPTLHALLTARALDLQVGRAEMALAKRAAVSPEVRERIVHSEAVLRAFYEREMLPRVVAARRLREEEKPHRPALCRRGKAGRGARTGKSLDEQKRCRSGCVSSASLCLAARSGAGQSAPANRRR